MAAIVHRHKEEVPARGRVDHGLERGAERVECTIDGRKWVQQPFPYQGKCLRRLREGFAGLAADDREFVDALLAGTGCEALLRD